MSRSQWQTFLEMIWPSRYDPVASYERRIAALQVVLAIAIALAAGPEIFVAVEMTAVMELLGALLFLAAMGAGGKLVALSVWSAIRKIALPIPLPVIVRPDASVPVKALAFVLVAGYALWCVALALTGRYVGAAGPSAEV